MYAHSRASVDTEKLDVTDFKILKQMTTPPRVVRTMQGKMWDDLKTQENVGSCFFRLLRCSLCQTSLSTPILPVSLLHSYPAQPQETYLFWEEGGKLSITAGRNTLVTMGQIHTWFYPMIKTWQIMEHMGHRSLTCGVLASFFCFRTSGPNPKEAYRALGYLLHWFPMTWSWEVFGF